MRKVLLISVIALFLSACASNGAKTIDRTNIAGSYSELSEKERYIAAVNRRARLTGVEVRWVHPPKTQHDGYYENEETEHEEDEDGNPN